jgi:hypothetical protein
MRPNPLIPTRTATVWAPLHDRKTRNDLKSQRRKALRPVLAEASPRTEVLDRPLILVRRGNDDNEPVIAQSFAPLGRAVDASIIKIAEKL